MKLMTYDCGYGVAACWAWRGRRYCRGIRLPLPVTLAGWRYLLRKRA